jgi:hypothetical protein
VKALLKKSKKSELYVYCGAAKSEGIDEGYRRVQNINCKLKDDFDNEPGG